MKSFARKPLFLFRKSAAMVALAASLMWPAASQAGSVSSTLFVSATVLNQCTIGNASLAFGNYDPSSGTPTNATGTLSVQCNSGTPYNVGLGAGTFSGATVTTRKMTGPDATGLGYALYRDPARTQNWGNTVGTDTVAGTGNGSSQSLTVYGQIPAGQSLMGGSYSDSITATLTF